MSKTILRKKKQPEKKPAERVVISSKPLAKPFAKPSAKPVASPKGKIVVSKKPPPVNYPAREPTKTKAGLYRLFAICPSALDPVLKKEVESLGANILDVYPGGVEFEGDLRVAYLAVLSLRTASRVLLLLKDVKKIFRPEELYQAIQSVDWTEVFPKEATFAVHFTQTQTKERSKPFQPQFWALKAKDAIVDQFRQKYDARPDVQRKDPDISIRLHLHDQILKIYLDLSGGSLHERGYLRTALEAPIKENLAAGLLLLADYDEKAKEQVPYYDPYCGSGTFLIEAAMIATHTAPGLLRTQFGFFSWSGHQQEVFEAVFQELKDKRVLDPAKVPMILGSDISGVAIRTAQDNIERAGFKDFIRLTQTSFQQTEPPAPQGLIVTNPPYGVRLDETEKLIKEYGEMGSALKHKYKGWTCGVITSDKRLVHAIALKPAKKIVIYNGSLESQFSIFNMY